MSEPEQKTITIVVTGDTELDCVSFIMRALGSAPTIDAGLRILDYVRARMEEKRNSSIASAWGIIAGADWTKESPEWVEAAKAWRDDSLQSEGRIYPDKK